MARLLLGVLAGPASGSRGPRPHALVPFGPLTAVTLPVDPAEAGSDAGLLAWATAQNAILAAYVADRDILPLPLGAVFSGEAAVRDHLARHEDHLSAGLAALTGRCEYLLRIRPRAHSPAPPDPGGDGRGFLAARKRHRDRGRTLAQHRRAFLTGIAAELDHLPLRVLTLPQRDPARLMDAALLVPRDQTARLVSTLRARGGQADDLALDCRLIGPAPAYSFARAAQPAEDCALG